MDSSGPPLPRIDSHATTSTAPADVVFASLWHVVRSSFGGNAAARYARAIRCDPPAAHAVADPVAGTTTVVGFAVTEVHAPHRLVLAGRHHYSRYRLEFDLAPRPDGGTRITATTFAVFPGVLGRLYRTAVLGTRAHVLVTRRLLRSVARAAERHATRSAGAPDA